MSDTDSRRLAVGIDGMSGLFEEQSDRPELSPYEKRRRWADNLVAVTGGVVRVGPDEAYTALQELRVQSPHLPDEEDYHLEVNRRLIARFAPELATREAAEELRRLLRQDNAEFTIYQDVRELVNWIVREFAAPLYVVTAQEDRKIKWMLRRWRNARRRVRGIITTKSVGYDKVRDEFWDGVLERVGVAPDRFIMIGSNVVTDTYATTRGIPVIVRDRDLFQTKFAYTTFEGHFRGAPILDIGEEVPPRRAFIGFARKTAHVKQWLLHIRDARTPLVHAGSQVA